MPTNNLYVLIIYYKYIKILLMTVMSKQISNINFKQLYCLDLSTYLILNAVIELNY